MLRRLADFLNAALRKLRLDLCGLHNNFFARKRAGHEDDFFLKIADTFSVNAETLNRQRKGLSDLQFDRRLFLLLVHVVLSVSI